MADAPGGLLWYTENSEPQHNGGDNALCRAAEARLLPVDALRGLTMAFMALDHANHFVAQKHSSGEMRGGPFLKEKTKWYVLFP